MTISRLLVTTLTGGFLACSAAQAAPGAAASAPVATPAAGVTPVVLAAVAAEAPRGRIAAARAADSVEALLASVGNISEGW